MADLDRTIRFYKKTFDRKEKQFNVPAKLPAYFKVLIGDKTNVKIAELGAGPVNTIGNYWSRSHIDIYASDILWPTYKELWGEKIPIIPVDYQDIEKLTYEDNFFDIVHCVNTLDHMENPQQAISEMKRVCKDGGVIYLRHAPNQMDRYGGMHRWNITETGFTNSTEHFDLSEFETEVLEDGLIVSILVV